MGQTISSARLEDRYYVQKVKLGQGSFGTVWRAVDRASNEVAAIKQLDKAAMPRRGVRRQDIEREITVMQAVAHDNIIRLLNSFEDSNSIYLALEYCDGGDFGDKVKQKGLQLKEGEAAEWMRQILSAIAALHAKCVCHRDIKPDNFMVTGEDAVLKLSDFGLALFLPRGRLLTEKCGTPAFMAPEQHRLPRHSRGYTNLCDIWAAGVTMYMLMFGGRHPFLANGSQLDERRLLSAQMDFNVSQGGFLSFGMGESRYSEGARRLCRRLAEPDPQRRPSVEEARQDPWLQSLVAPVTHRPAMRRQGTGEFVGQAPVILGSPPAGVAVPPQQPGISRDGSSRGFPPRPGAGPPSYSPTVNGAELARGNSGNNWWPFAMDQNAPPPNAPVAEGKLGENQEALKKRIEILEQQLAQQLEQNESQWEVMQQLADEKKKLVEWQDQVAGSSLISAPAYLPERQKTKALGAPQQTGVTTGRQALVGEPPLTLAVPAACRLAAGLRCRYNSKSWSWMPAVVQSFNDSDGTYNLDVRLHAKLENISPAPDVSATEAWPPGTLVYYESGTIGRMLPAVVRSFNESTGSGEEGTYNLDVREYASVDKMRPRLS